MCVLFGLFLCLAGADNMAGAIVAIDDRYFRILAPLGWSSVFVPDPSRQILQAWCLGGVLLVFGVVSATVGFRGMIRRFNRVM